MFQTPILGEPTSCHIAAEYRHPTYIIGTAHKKDHFSRYVSQIKFTGKLNDELQ